MREHAEHPAWAGAACSRPCSCRVTTLDQGAAMIRVSVPISVRPRWSGWTMQSCPGVSQRPWLARLRQEHAASSALQLLSRPQRPSRPSWCMKMASSLLPQASRRRASPQTAATESNWMGVHGVVSLLTCTSCSGANGTTGSSTSDKMALVSIRSNGQTFLGPRRDTTGFWKAAVVALSCYM